jgi:hypothetical protein
MAVLTTEQKASLRRFIAGESQTVGWNKAQVDAMMQAIDDWADANQASLNAAINAATQPLGITFTAGQKTRAFVYWCLMRHLRDR